MKASIETRIAQLENWLAAQLQADSAQILNMAKLSGGAIQENWLIDVYLQRGSRPGNQEWVLRTDASSTISTSHGRAEEFALLEVAFQVGVSVPEPILLCTDTSLIGGPFYLMTRAQGTAHSRKIVRDPALSEFGDQLAEQLGKELAILHQVKPPNTRLHFLPKPDMHAAQFRITQYRTDLDALPQGHPVLEFALNWLEDNKPAENEIVLCHSDYRTGNYMVSDGKLTAILDWEFASWSDPMEDIGWMCAPCWRFGNDHLHVGGIAKLEPFLRGYESITDKPVDRSVIPYWQVMAELRWAIIALQQGERCHSDTEVTLELALTGLMAPDMEMNILNLIQNIAEDAS